MSPAKVNPYADPKIREATAEELGRKQRQSIYEAFIPNSFGFTPKVCIWDGSIRTGKTIASLLAWTMFVAKAPRGGELVVVGRTRESIARNVFGPLQDPEIMGPLAGFITYTSGAPTAKMFGRTIHVLGASDVRAEAVLRGLTVAGAYVDEGTLIAEPFWIQLLGRMSVLGAQCFVTTNPDGPHHWMHKSVIAKYEMLGYKRFHFTIDDAEYLQRTNPEYFEQLHREFTGLWKLRFLDGLWVQAEGAVYSMWDPEVHVVKEADIPQIDQLLCVGGDFGTTHPTRAYLVGIGRHEGDRKDTLYTLGEFAPETDKTVGYYSAEFQAWLAREETKWSAHKRGRKPLEMHVDWIAWDPAAKHFRRQLFEDGITNIAAHNAKSSGIQTISALLAVGRLLVSETCLELIDHIPGYMWDPKASDRGEEEPIKENDDELDAWRYAIYTSRRFWRGRIAVTPARDDAPGAADIDEEEAA